MSIPFDEPSAVGRTFIDLGEDITAAVLTTIREGWQEARLSPDVNPTALEVPMTERLRDAMRAVVNRGGLPWSQGMIIARGTESMSTPGLPSPDGRTDIPLYLIEIFFTYDEHDPHAIIECKRVAEGNSPLIHAYVDEGVDRFVSGKYGPNHAIGFMLGYVLSGLPSRIVLAINDYLEHLARRGETLAEAAPVGTCWSSLHPRVANQGIRLHHTMVET